MLIAIAQPHHAIRVMAVAQPKNELFDSLLIFLTEIMLPTDLEM